MTSPETTVLRQRLVRVITRRVGSSTGGSAVAAAARLTHDDLTVAFAPLISSAGVDALWGRAFDLAQREYPANASRGDNRTADEPFAQVTRWLESQVPSVATDAAAAMFATFADLLTALIGEPLTMRYLEKAWPNGFSDAQPKGKKA
ncbi:MAG TPA: hypothetical protein VM733_18005 [Thermoanaerobaculia bacterium]|nr:hypothetical protein [Thermoanaerobaculia bacterium]